MTTCEITECLNPPRSSKEPLCYMHYFRQYRNGTPLLPSVCEKVWPKFDRDVSGCWIWKGSIDRNGYGKYGGEWAHRFMYRLLVDADLSLHLDHLCRTPLCVNPAHLEPVIHAENVHRASTYTRSGTCRRGHPATEDSTYTRSNGKRECRVCRAEREGRA